MKSTHVNVVEVDALLIQANSYAKLDQLREASRYWNLACSKRQGKPDTYLLRSRLLIHSMLLDGCKGDFLSYFVPKEDEQERELEIVLEIFQAIDDNNRKEAVALITQLIEGHESEFQTPAPSCFYQLRSLSTLNIEPYKRARLELALNDLSDCIALDDPDDSVLELCNVELSKAVLYMQVGEFDEAQDLFLKVENEIDKSIKEDDRGAWEVKLLEMTIARQRGNIHFATGAYDQAREHYSDSFERSREQLALSSLLLEDISRGLVSALPPIDQGMSRFEEQVQAKWQCLLETLSASLSSHIYPSELNPLITNYIKTFSYPQSRAIGIMSFYKSILTLGSLNLPRFTDSSNKLDLFAELLQRHVVLSHEHLLNTLSLLLYHIAQGNEVESDKYERLAMNMRIDHHDLYIAIGAKRLAAGKLTEAQRAFDKAVDSAHPFLSSSASAYAERAYFYTHTFDYEKARADLIVAQRMSPRLASVHNEWGRLYSRLNERELAKQHFDTSEAINPHDIKTLTTIAACRLEHYDYSGAYEYLIKAHHANAHEFTFLYYTGIVLSKCELYEQAHRCAKLAHRCNASDCRSYLLESYIYFCQGTYNASLTALEKAYQHNHSDLRIFTTWIPEIYNDGGSTPRAL